MAAKCTHLDQMRIASTDKHVCQECIKTGDTWVHLRRCLECGHVGCCGSSKNKHATNVKIESISVRRASNHADLIIGNCNQHRRLARIVNE